MQIENVMVTKTHDPDSRYEDDNVPEENATEHELDSPENLALLTKIREWWDQSRQIESENREQQAIDDDFYDGLQWADEDILELQERGQAPLVFNLTKQSVDWIIGTERRTRIDFNVFARNDDKTANQEAQNKTKLLKYLSDVNKAPNARSLAFADAVKTGVGWLEDGIRNDESDELLFSRHESWRNVWRDQLSFDRDLDDSRFLFRARWIDLDLAIQMFPDRENELRSSADAQTMISGDDETDDFWYARLYSDSQSNVNIRRGWVDDTGSLFNRRERVRLIECWYREPARVKKMRGWNEDLNGTEYDDTDDLHKKAVDEQIVSLYDAVVMKMNVAIFSGAHLFQVMPSPYKHNKFPLTPVWAYRRGRDNTPYGVIRNVRDPQEDMNKRASKALFILSTNKIIADKKAVDDWNETIEQASRPDGVIKVNGDRKFELITDRELAEEHLMVMDRDQSMIRNSSGVQGENIGDDTNAISGKAILVKQNEGSLVTFELFDNFRYSLQLQGEKQLSMVEQFYDLPKTIRLIGERGDTEYLNLNEPQWNEVEGRYVFLNDVSARQADFVIDQQDFRATIRQAMFEQLMDMLSKMESTVALQLLDLVVEMSDLPGKDELVSRIRKLNGQTAPDEEESEEDRLAREQKEKEQEQVKQLELDEIMSKIDERLAKTEKTRVETQKTAMDAGETVVSIPGAAPAADAVLDTAGFKDQGV